MNDNKVRLYVMGLSVSQLKTGAYALILAEENGRRRIPLVIGDAEAKSIALVMEGITPPRPITHDLFVSFAHAFGVRVLKVFIYKFEDGIFHSQITFRDESGHQVVMDARTSDAVAIAIRTDTPIETTEDIIRQTGFIMTDDMVRRADEEPPAPDGGADTTDDSIYGSSGYHATPKLENYTIEELERTLTDLIANEEYEEAERVSQILERKKKAQNNDSQNL